MILLKSYMYWAMIVFQLIPVNMACNSFCEFTRIQTMFQGYKTFFHA